MTKALFLAVVLTCLPILAANNNAELRRLQLRADGITITRDDWGIAHVHGKTDADAVFGMVYAQAEDDFNRVETNYLNSMGRLAEAEGEAKIYQDLRMKLFISPEGLKAKYAESPAWLKKLMIAFADGLNYYLTKHPEVKPRVISHFEPWMALSFTEGSIGGDIEKINLKQLEAFYGQTHVAVTGLPGDRIDDEPSGSNGIAIAPSNTVAHHALLLINPHTSFFFRSELQMSSDEGLNAYGAVTWGQFFVYQGFNEHAGWMHTSSGVDAVDQYLETVEKRSDGVYYKYGDAWRKMDERQITVPYRAGNGMAQKTFTVYRTQHGPIIRQEGEKWVSIRLMQEPIKALMQSYLRTKAINYASYRKTMELKANSSNNTIFADKDGDIAYFHGNFIPRRDASFDFTKPVDGSDPRTDWQGLLTIDETPHLLNPESGWIYNCNNAPWSAAGESSPKKEDYPPYVEKGGESPRGRHAFRLLRDKKDFTLDSLTTAAFDSYLPWFESPLQALFAAYDREPVAELSEQIDLLRKWDLRWGVDSVATSLAIFWGDDVRKHSAKGDGSDVLPGQLLQSLRMASGELNEDFGTWRKPWGDINRFERISADIVQPFTDSGPSIPVGFVSGNFGSLASFGAHAYPGTKKWYGTSGNSFVAVVEFGDKVRARAVTAGGESGHMDSKHFNDEALRYASGKLRDVYFYPADLKGHVERQYHPGE